MVKIMMMYVTQVSKKYMVKNQCYGVLKNDFIELKQFQEYLAHPVKKHMLIRNLPSTIRNKLMHQEPVFKC